MYRAARSHVRLDTSLESLLEHVRRDDVPRVLATVVATAGSTYRKHGARMLIMADGRHHGLLSGGCLEADLNLHAHDVLASGCARAVEYDMRGPDDILFGIGAGCEGAMRVLLEPAGPGSPAESALIGAGRATQLGLSTVLVAVHESANFRLGTYGGEAALPDELRGATRRGINEAVSREVRFHWDDRPGRAFVQCLPPAPQLLVCGGGADAQPVVSAALSLGWRVTVVDHRTAYALTARFPGALVRLSEARALGLTVQLDHYHAAVVMSHHLPSDVAYLRCLAEAGVPDFIGLLGPSARRRRIAEELGSAAQSLGSRIRGPVGIDIGAVTPEGIALSIISQIHAWLAGRLAEPPKIKDCSFAPGA
jgi:xanthine/CO dehydrogenase XdhC/CoxF family maturation factor